jgi:hypothetical protein
MFSPMLSNIECQLLRHYSEEERLIGKHARSQQHLRLLALGYIREHVVDAGNLLVIVTAAGLTALNDGPTVA